MGGKRVGSPQGRASSPSYRSLPAPRSTSSSEVRPHPEPRSLPALGAGVGVPRDAAVGPARSGLRGLRQAWDSESLPRAGRGWAAAFGHCTAVPVLGCSSREESYPSLASQPSSRAKRGRKAVVVVVGGAAPWGGMGEDGSSNAMPRCRVLQPPKARERAERCRKPRLRGRGAGAAGRERGTPEKRLCTPREEKRERSSEDGEEGAGRKQGSEQLKQIGRPPADRR